MLSPDDLSLSKKVLETLQTDQNIELYKSIPGRVKSRVPLKVSDSNISGAGRGAFVLKAVKAGDLIFSIAKPLICIVNDGEEMLCTTCDNCFANCSDGVPTVSRKNLKFTACGGCKVLHYCSKVRHNFISFLNGADKVANRNASVGITGSGV
jgi:hypothetical protein